MNGIGSHTSPNAGASDSWITPKFILEALGPFDLDPCKCTPQPWECAKSFYLVTDDGLSKDWEGRVWLNPPYGKSTGIWLDKLARHGQGTALIFARTETRMFVDHVWGQATALLFLHGRLFFHYPDGTRAPSNSGGPSVLIAYGESDAEALMKSTLPGSYVRGWK